MMRNNVQRLGEHVTAPLGHATAATVAVGGRIVVRPAGTSMRYVTSR